MAESRSRSGGGQEANPSREGRPSAGAYDQMQIVAQVIDLRMDVRGLETKTERAISDIGALTSEVKTGLSAANKSTHAVEVDMAKLVERVNHLPSKGFIVGALLLSLTVIGALVIFQGNIARLVGAAPAVSSVTTR